MSHTYSDIDRIADDYVNAWAALDPVGATESGVAGDEHALTDYSPAGIAARADLTRATIAKLQAATPTDEVDRVSVATITDQLQRELALVDAGVTVGELNVLASPLQSVRDVFDLMSTDTADGQAAVLDRAAAIPQTLARAAEGLRARVAAGTPVAQRQVKAVAAQAATAGDTIAKHLHQVVAADAATAPHAERAETALRAALDDFIGVLTTEVAPHAREQDAVGSELYALYSAAFVGTSIEPREAYEFGVESLAAIEAEQQAVAAQIVSGATVLEAQEALNNDPRYQIDNLDEFVAWMQQTSDAAVQALGGVHFDIPDRISELACKVAPAGSGGIYYTSPAEDGSRPGTMWWSVPPTQERIYTWQEKSSVFHEGVPGHHLQLGTAVTSPDLNRWRKSLSFTSGHGEGWALYAERLMAELGWLEDPGDRMGMLDSQRLRAARVVVDIGVHCQLPAPDSVGGGIWDADKAWQFLRANVASDEAVLRFELNRYLGWPGQAPSYALGQRVWQNLRDSWQRAHPDTPVKEFHTQALALGGVTLDVLTRELGQN